MTAAGTAAMSSSVPVAATGGSSQRSRSSQPSPSAADAPITPLACTWEDREKSEREERERRERERG
jgi:hypothetical protein